MLKRPPDFIVGNADNPYLLRWWVIPRNPWFNIYLHKFLRDDDDRALHDHPWASCSIILNHGYIEWYPCSWCNGSGYVDYAAVRCENCYGHKIQAIFRPPLMPIFRKATQAHRVELYKTERIGDTQPTPIPTWSLFFTGPWQRNWGFHCPRGWVPWREYVAVTPGGNEIGKGCDD